MNGPPIAISPAIRAVEACPSAAVATGMLSPGAEPARTMRSPGTGISRTSTAMTSGSARDQEQKIDELIDVLARRDG